MADDRHVTAAVLAAAVFAKSPVAADQDPIKEIVSIYKKIRRRLESANASLAEEDRAKLENTRST